MTRTIYLQQTDATGCLYFPQILQMGIEAFESYLSAKGKTLQTMIDEGDFLLPIVHAEGELKARLTVGETVQITLFLLEKGTTSFTLQAVFSKPHLEGSIGSTKIVHVCIDKESGTPKPISELILRDLRELQQVSFQ